MFTKESLLCRLPLPGEEIEYTFWSTLQNNYITVVVDDVPYCISIVPHPTCANYETYNVEFEVTSSNILFVDTHSEFCPGVWAYPQIARELNEHLSICLVHTPKLKEQLIKEELELCLA